MMNTCVCDGEWAVIGVRIVLQSRYRNKMHWFAWGSCVPIPILAGNLWKVQALKKQQEAQEKTRRQRVLGSSPKRVDRKVNVNGQDIHEKQMLIMTSNQRNEK